MPWFWSIFDTAVDGSPRRIALGLVLDPTIARRYLDDQRQARARDIHTGEMIYLRPRRTPVECHFQTPSPPSFFHS